jgi:Ca2+-transporting ATPase
VSSQEKQTYNLEIHEALNQFRSSKSGLSNQEAAARLKTYGLNELTSAKTPLWRRIIEPFTSYFVIVIIIAACISAFERKWFETIIISTIVIVNAVIYYFQQFSVNRVLKTLHNQDKQVLLVMRDGDETKISSELLVPGDIIYLSEGIKVPADGRIIEASNLQADESLLTGESLPVHKLAAAIEGHKEIYAQSNMLFKGSYVKSGKGIMLVSGTGNNTQLGTINTLAAEADDGKTPIQVKIDSLTKKLIIGIAIITIAVFSLAIYRGIDLKDATAFTLSILVSAVPEGLPVAMTLVLLLSARRMASQKALVKHISAMETMGAVTLIATDKTGTITQNKLAVAQIYSPQSDTQAFHKLIRASLNGEADNTEDPLDKILHDQLKGVHMPQGWAKTKEFPFDQQLRLSGVVWQYAGAYILFIKGAPEQVLHHCKQNAVLEGAKQQLKSFTGKGYRTIAFAGKTLSHLPEELNSTILSNMDFNGFVGMSDQLRTGVTESIQQAKLAGVKVVMLTGDHIETAGYIAKTVGISDNAGNVSDSNVLENGTTEQVLERLETTTVFGRVLPQHKYALLKAIKGHEITAMTGDGVNDIPALVEADTGLAMGSGTDAAKDASDIVLIDSNFQTIVNAVRIGRMVLANIRKMVVYLLGTSGGEVLTMLMALVLNIPLPITAVMVLWVNLVTDGISVIPLGLSPAEEHHMKQPPKDPKAPLLDKILLTRAILLAISMAAITLFVFKINLHHGEAYARTAAFLTLIVIQWANAFNINFESRSWTYNFIKPNWKLVGAIGFSIAINWAVFTTPVKNYFGLASLQLMDALVAIVIPVILALLLCDAHKAISNVIAKQRVRRTISA